MSGGVRRAVLISLAKVQKVNTAYFLEIFLDKYLICKEVGGENLVNIQKGVIMPHVMFLLCLFYGSGHSRYGTP